MSRLVVVGVLLAATLAACSSTAGTSPSATPSPLPSNVMRVDGSFESSSSGLIALTGRPVGVGSTSVPATPGATPSPQASSAWKVSELSVDFYAPASLDGTSGALLLTLNVADDTRVYDEAGALVPRSEQYHELGRGGRWTATIARGESTAVATVELRRLGESDTSAMPPAVRGLLESRSDGLLGVPGQPSDQSGGHGRTWIEIVQPVLVDGLRADAVSNLAVGSESKVVTTPQREGSTEKLLTWVSEFGDRHRWQTTARLSNHVLVLATLEQL